MRRSLIAALLLAACGPTAPTPAPADKTDKTAEPAPAPAKAAEATPAATGPAQEVAVKREPPLTPEEIQLIESDPNTLTPDQRRLRAHALRRKILQNPDSPQAKQLEQLRKDVEAGLVTPQLTTESRDKSAPNNDLVLSAPEPSKPAEKAP